MRPEKSAPVLKQFGDITLSDFGAHPVWVQCHVIDYDEPWYDETDEETFRPWNGDLPVDPAEAMFLVKAQLKLADRKTFPGFVTPQSAENEGAEPRLGLMQPHLFLPSGACIGFWQGIAPWSEPRTRLYEELGMASSEVFPITFEAERDLARGLSSGEVRGFYVMTDDGFRVEE